MLKKLRIFASLLRELGPRWMLFRLVYSFRIRTGLIRLRFPTNQWDDYKENIGTSTAQAIFFPSVTGEVPLPRSAPWNPRSVINEADQVLNGSVEYFSHQFIKTGFPPNWHKDYISHSNISEEQSIKDSRRHWAQISDDSSSDIKFIWEPNRFVFVYTLIRAYAASKDEKYPEAFWTLVEDWAKHNHPNTGHNWMDGQEVSLRLMAWTFGYHAFRNSPSSTPERKDTFLLYVAAHAERIHKDASFAVHARVNHAITEAFALWMIGMLFPQLKKAQAYVSFGQKSLEQEARNQIFPDGTYSMYSLNYHRFVLHIYLCALQLAEINKIRFSNELNALIEKSIEYLSQLVDPQTGHMPVYGSNDGALVLPLDNCDYADYRPLLQLGWLITKGELLFEHGQWDEGLFWVCGRYDIPSNPSSVRIGGKSSFPNGGNYILRSNNSRAFIRCTEYTSRPSHADQLHMDLWVGKENIAIDAGTYLYSGKGLWRNGLAHTAAHNTVIVDGQDQMSKITRFTWTNWSKGNVLAHTDSMWVGEHDGYNPVTHKRTIKSLGEDRWLVIDDLAAVKPHHYALHWLLNDYLFDHMGDSIVLTLESMRYKLQTGILNGKGEMSIVRADAESARGWRSRYYGQKEPAVSVMLEIAQPQATFWSFFGAEDDKVEWIGDVVRVNSRDIPL